PDTLRVHVARALEKWRLRHENTRLRTLVPLLQRAQAFAEARNREQVYAELFQAAGELLETEEIAFCHANAEGDAFTLVQAQGAHFSALRDTVWFASELPNITPFHSNRVQVWNEAEEKRLPAVLDALQWIMCAPLRAHDKTLGVLLVARNTPPSQADVEALHLIASQAATALENVDLLTEISRAYLNARELERLKSEFINIAGHEIRTPLSILLGYAILLHERLDGEERGFAAELVTHAQRLQRIVVDMLNLKYLEAG